MNDRDHFAAAALTGLLSFPDGGREIGVGAWAHTAYQLADAMLRERELWPGATTGDTQTEAYVDLPTGDPNVVNRVPVKFTNHDAAPAARSDDRECAAHVATGGTQEPFAWYGSAGRTDGGSVVCLCMTDEELGAEIYARDTCAPRKVIPLYRQPQPTFTDAEREAVKWAVFELDNLPRERRYSKTAERADTLRGLMERMGCGK